VTFRPALILAALAATAATAAAHNEGKKKHVSGCDKTVGPDAALAEVIAALPEGAVLCLEKGSYPLNVVVEKSITLRGMGAPADVVLDGGGRGSVIKVGAAKAVTVEKLTIANGASRNGGGGIAHPGLGTLAVRDVILRNNRADGFGGAALLLGGGEATVERCRVVDNAGGIGGAIIVDDVARAAIRHTLITGNKGTSSVVYAHDNAQLELDHVTIAGNQAAAGLEVRAITVRAPTVKVSDSIVCGTTAIANGPRLAGQVTASRCLMEGEQQGVTDGGGNKAGGPAFDSAGSEPFRPSTNSPARGLAHAGHGTDLAGAPSSTTAGAIQ
jgi:hypothetical protein